MTIRWKRAASSNSALSEVTSASGLVMYRLFQIASGVVVQRSVKTGKLSRTDYFVRFTDRDSLVACAELEERCLKEPRFAGRLMSQFDAALPNLPVAANVGKIPLDREADHTGHLMRVVQRVGGAGSQAEVLELLHEAKNILGADASAYVSVIPEPRSSPSLQVLFDGSAPALYQYGLANDALNDPWIAYAQAQARRPFVDENLTDEPLPNGGLASIDALRHSVLIPTPSSDGLLRFGFLVLGAARLNDFEVDEAAMRKIMCRALAEEVSAWWLRRSGVELKNGIGIDELDLRILALQNEGVIAAETATALGMTEAEASNRLRSVVKRFNVADITGAVQRAAEYGLIETPKFPDTRFSLAGKGLP